MSTVAIVATGGTIQNTPAGRIPVTDVLDALRDRYTDPPRLDGVEIVTEEVSRAASEALAPKDWLGIGRAVAERVGDPDVTGVVVTHGTFTAEETAYFLHLAVHTHKPVVLAVSQRKHGTVGNDGDRNLVEAIRVAADPSASGRGVLLVANEEIHCAREVTKYNQRPGAFWSLPFGPLGTVETDRVSLYRSPSRRHTSSSAFARAETLERPDLPRVDVAVSYAGADSTAVDAFVAAGARGVVLAGFAYSGRGTDAQLSALRAAADRGVLVCLASRGRGGRIPATGEPWPLRADNLTPQKARVILALIAAGAERGADAQALLDTH